MRSRLCGRVVGRGEREWCCIMGFAPKGRLLVLEVGAVIAEAAERAAEDKWRDMLR